MSHFEYIFEHMENILFYIEYNEVFSTNEIHIYVRHGTIELS